MLAVLRDLRYFCSSREVLFQYFLIVSQIPDQFLTWQMLASFPPFMICNMNRGIYYLFHLLLYSAPDSKWWPNDFPGKKSCLSPRNLKEKCIYFNDFKAIPVWLMWGFLEDNDCIYEVFLKSAFHNLWHALLPLCQNLWNTVHNYCWQLPLHFVFGLLSTGKAMIPILSLTVTLLLGLPSYLKAWSHGGRAGSETSSAVTSACRNCFCSWPVLDCHKVSFRKEVSSTTMSGETKIPQTICCKENRKSFVALRQLSCNYREAMQKMKSR